MSIYVKDLYGSVGQQFQGALVPNSVNANTGNLIHRLNGGRRKNRKLTKGGDMGAILVPGSILAMQQFYGRKSKKGASKRFRYKSRRFRKTR